MCVFNCLAQRSLIANGVAQIRLGQRRGHAVPSSGRRHSAHHVRLGQFDANLVRAHHQSARCARSQSQPGIPRQHPRPTAQSGQSARHEGGCCRAAADHLLSGRLAQSAQLSAVPVGGPTPLVGGGGRRGAMRPQRRSGGEHATLVDAMGGVREECQRASAAQHGGVAPDTRGAWHTVRRSWRCGDGIVVGQVGQ